MSKQMLTHIHALQVATGILALLLAGCSGGDAANVDQPASEAPTGYTIVATTGMVADSDTINGIGNSSRKNIGKVLNPTLNDALS